MPTATVTTRVLVDGGSILVEQGDEYPADHPLVKRMPSLFGLVRDEPVVETATRRPGEKSRARRTAHHDDR